MAINQINEATFDYAMMLNVINLSYKTQADITITNFDDDTATQVTAGSIFANNGAIFENTTLATPTGYAGISNSTTFYLYLDVEPTPTFIFSSVAPTWSDAKQGWYNGNDRAFFSMFKDSGGTLYQNKVVLGNNNKTLKMILNIGDWDMDADGTKTVSSGIGYNKIENIQAIIKDDTDSLRTMLTGASGGIAINSAGLVTLSRPLTSAFNNTDYESTSYNRGVVIIWYSE